MQANIDASSMYQLEGERKGLRGLDVQKTVNVMMTTTNYHSLPNTGNIRSIKSRIYESDICRSSCQIFQMSALNSDTVTIFILKTHFKDIICQKCSYIIGIFLTGSFAWVHACVHVCGTCTFRLTVEVEISTLYW